MNQHNFDILLEKYLAANCSEEEEKQVLDWFEKQQKHAVILPLNEQKNTEKRMWLFIRSQTKDVRPMFKIFSWQKIGLAASVLLLITFSFFIVHKTLQKEIASIEKSILNEGVVVENTTKNKQEITLDDGSKVMLYAQSSISYPEHFGKKNRIVYLKGAAFFEVKKDPTKPFIVHAGNITTEVLGTSFSIQSYNDSKTIEVAVKTGRVSVFENDNSSGKTRKGVILTPNQRIVFDKQTKAIIPSIVEQPQPLVKPENPQSFIFEETSIIQVFDKLRVEYGLEIVLESPAFSNCFFTGDLNDLSLETQLDLVCKSINANHEQRGTSIFINGEGCK
jgi:transmembrane sensor